MSKCMIGSAVPFLLLVLEIIWECLLFSSSDYLIEVLTTYAFSALLLQLLRLRRPFVAYITDAMGNEVFRVRRPFWWITSSIYAEINGKYMFLSRKLAWCTDDGIFGGECMIYTWGDTGTQMQILPVDADGYFELRGAPLTFLYQNTVDLVRT
ncbi:hypothetical protein JRO89_XS04G0056800 [Xanthoceras sorbifolium]|uniref:Phospholipid scramblase n=1 Tax=Xanthoceras sorbifolium TaxID=99658 RepID=A0ABQ8I494_9ROSI|nr:hypothetical protein JRO89_XS04G0056800 [Xanthoceras sorbifolium]